MLSIKVLPSGKDGGDPWGKVLCSCPMEKRPFLSAIRKRGEGGAWGFGRGTGPHGAP